MRYLDPTELKAIVNANRIIEQLLEKRTINDIVLLRYLNIFRSRESKYGVSLHEVFDDRDQGVENIYYFSHFDPDSPEGSINYFDSYEDALVYSKSLGASPNKFLMEGNLQEEFLNGNEGIVH